MTEEKHSDVDELESAVHYLREAQQIRESGEKNLKSRDATLGMIENAMEEIGNYIEGEIDET